MNASSPAFQPASGRLEGGTSFKDRGQGTNSWLTSLSQVVAPKAWLRVVCRILVPGLVLYGGVLPIAENFGALKGVPGFGDRDLYLGTEPHRVPIFWVDWRPVWAWNGSVHVSLDAGSHRIRGIADGRAFSHELTIWRHETYAEVPWGGR